LKIFHVTTPKKAKRYLESGFIKSPVRGFTSIQGAMAWAMKVGRKVIYEIESDNVHKLPDHHNRWGESWWIDEDVKDFHCIFSADNDA